MEWTKLNDTALNNVSGGNNEEEKLRNKQIDALRAEIEEEKLLKEKADDLYIEIRQLDDTIKYLKQKLEQEKQK